MADKGSTQYRRSRIAHWDRVFIQSEGRGVAGDFYHRLLQNKYRQLVRPGLRVLELGCGDGSLLAAVRPSFGVGVDFSDEALKVARVKNPQNVYVRADAAELPFSTEFDIVVLSDLLNDLWDVQQLFDSLARFIHSKTRLILNTHSRLWQLPLNLAEKLGLKAPTLPQNWFTVEDINNLARHTNLETIKHVPEILLPVWVPIFSWLLNSVIAKFPPFSFFNLTNFLVLRPLAIKGRPPIPTVSVIVPARNEAGNIAAIFDRLPQIGSDMEIIFIEGHSKDNTRETIETEIARRPEANASLLNQTGLGKATAVWQGFAAAKNDILVILDSDLSVPPEDLPRFYQAIAEGKGEMINGSRLVYPMEGKAMAFANLLGNKAFSMIFSWLIEQPVKDTLCGTKVFWREDFETLKKNWDLFGKVDPFGDFDMLLGATQLNLRIIDLPVRYRERTYGATNIQRWRHGLMLARITIAAMLNLKFV